MAEVLVDFDIRLVAEDGTVYEPQACGRAREDGLWEGWIEFVPLDGEPVRSGRETTQPNRDDLMYWAQGLTATYLEGSLNRVVGSEHRPPPRREPIRRAAFDAPAPPHWRSAEARARAVLDPFQVYGQGVGVLRGQLDALGASQLRNIARAWELSDADAAELDTMTHAELTELIIAGVERVAH